MQIDKTKQFRNVVKRVHSAAGNGYRINIRAQWAGVMLAGKRDNHESALYFYIVFSYELITFLL